MWWERSQVERVVKGKMQGQIEYQSVPNFERTGALVDLSRYSAGLVKDEFVPWRWNQVVLGTGMEAIPGDTGPLGMEDRDDFFKKDTIAVLTTWAHYAAAATKRHATVDKTDFPPKQGGWLWQNGGISLG